MAKYVAAIDQGTTSTRFIVFDHGGNVVSVAQKEHKQIFPKPGWVEHEPLEIWRNTLEVTERGLKSAHLQPADLAAIGITNQRETTIVWDKHTGKPVYNAIVWQDTRTDEIIKKLARAERRSERSDSGDEDRSRSAALTLNFISVNLRSSASQFYLSAINSFNVTPNLAIPSRMVSGEE